MDAIAPWWIQADLARRQQGRFLDALGLGPQTTPSRRLRPGSGGSLHAYGAPRSDRPAVLAVPAPIKAAYIWDLEPDVSVVRRCLGAGLQVYLVDWEQPQTADACQGLAHYAAFIEGCLRVVTGETGLARVFLAGHSLGGTLAAIAASLDPERILGLLELEGPMHFGAHGPLEAAAARARAPADADDVGNLVPGTALDALSLLADPVSFGLEPWLDAWNSWLSPGRERLHWRVRRWTLDESPLPRRLFEEVLEELYRKDRFAERALVVGGQRADPQAITAPIAAVLDRRSRVIPPASVEAYRSRSASRDVELLEYGGDAGVVLQHLGVLVGENAHRALWPALLAWMERVWHADVH